MFAKRQKQQYSAIVLLVLWLLPGIEPKGLAYFDIHTS